MGLRSWLKVKAGNSANGQYSPDPSPPSPSPGPPPAIPRAEPHMATDLGYALTAYWRNGKWFGSDAIIMWMINHGHIAEAAYALDEALKASRFSPKGRKRLSGCVRRLEEATRATDIPATSQADEAS